MVAVVGLGGDGRQRIAVIPGDGIGVGGTAAARTVLDAVAARHGIDLAYEEFDWSCRRYAERAR